MRNADSMQQAEGMKCRGQIEVRRQNQRHNYAARHCMPLSSARNIDPSLLCTRYRLVLSFTHPTVWPISA